MDLTVSMAIAPHDDNVLNGFIKKGTLIENKKINITTKITFTLLMLDTASTILCLAVTGPYFFLFCHHKINARIPIKDIKSNLTDLS